MMTVQRSVTLVLGGLLTFMRKSALFVVLLASSFLLVWSGCSKPEEPLNPSLATTASCNVTMTYLGTKTLIVSPNSTNNNASWHVNNNGTSAVTLNGQTLSKSGVVTAARTNVWAPFPYSLAAGSKIDADLRFDVGASGTGTVGMTVSSSCGSIVAPAHLVSVQSTATGIPYGLSGIRPDSIRTATIWTGGSRTNKQLSAVLVQLRDNPNKLRMWWNITSGDEQVFRVSATDTRFKVQAWIDTLNNHVKPFKSDSTSKWNDSLTPYINDGTLQGEILLDDLASFSVITGAQIDSIAAYSKKRFPTLVTAARARPTKLETYSGGAPYRTLDVGWGQYKTGATQGEVSAYRDAEIAAAQRLTLGLVLGINVTNAGNFANGTTDAPPDSLLLWGKALLKAVNSDYVCGFIMWNTSYAYVLHANMDTLANLAKNHVAAPCKRR
jgi:hypothetical protein